MSHRLCIFKRYIISKGADKLFTISSVINLCQEPQHYAPPIEWFMLKDLCDKQTDNSYGGYGVLSALPYVIAKVTLSKRLTGTININV